MSYAPPPPPPPPPPPGYSPPPPPGYSPPPPPGSGYGAPAGGYYYGPPQPPGAPAPHGTRAGGTRMIGVFVGALLGIAVLVGIIIFAGRPGPPDSCPPDTLCPPPPRQTLAPGQTLGPGQTLPPLKTPAPTPIGQTPGPGATPVPTPVSNAAPYVAGQLWRSPTLGYSFEYDAETWRLEEENDTFARLKINFRPELELGPVELDVIGFAGDTSVDAALASVYAQIDTFVIGRAPNPSTYDALLGPGIGYVRGKGEVFVGTMRNADGSPGAPAGITIMASTNGRATVVVLVLTTNPDKVFNGMTVQLLGRRDADEMVKTFLWDSQ